MKTIVLLCGADRSGKSNTLKRFFRVSGRLKPNQLLIRVLNGKTIYAVSASAPQELEKFCKVEDVKARIEKRIEKCEEASQGKDYILILPFGIYAKKGKKEISEPCILEPKKWLETRGLKILAIYLRKEKNAYVELKDALMKRIAKHLIMSDMDYDRQAKELEEIIRNFIK
jgi:ribonucleotide reductase alpha subunit